MQGSFQKKKKKRIRKINWLYELIIINKENQKNS